MYRIIISFFLLCSLAQAQDGIYPNEVSRAWTVKLDTLAADSTMLFELPSGIVIDGIYLSVDSTITGSAGDSIKIGIRGERTIPSFRFADFPYDSLPQGTKTRLSHYHFRQAVAGALYAYDTDALQVACADVETYYPVEGLHAFPYNDFSVTTGGAMKVPPYRDGWYQVALQASFSSSKANVDMHGELFKNGAGYDYASFERTISTASQIGSASFVGGVYLAEGDTLKFKVKSDVASTVYSIQHCQFILIRQMDGTPYVTDATRQIWLYTEAATGQIRVFIRYRQLY